MAKVTYVRHPGGAIYVPVIITGPEKRSGEPVIGADFSAMSDQALQHFEWKTGHARIHVRQGQPYVGDEERARLNALADAELTRRGVHERYT